MVKSEIAEGKTSSRKSNRIFLLVGLVLFIFVLLAPACTVIANSKVTQESIQPDNSISQTVPTSQPTTTNTAEPQKFDTAVPATVETAAPTLLPSLTPIPTSTPTEEPPLPTASPIPTMTISPTLSTEEITPTKPPPLPTPAGVLSWTLKVPIMMYHYISIPPEDADKYRTDLSISPDDFREQMAYLAENGFETIDFYDLSLAITGKRELPEKPIILSFDDGYRDNYENAFPILLEYGLSGTFFIVTQPIDDGNSTYMNWEMVEEMAKAGMRIEPHSKTHPDLSLREKEYIIFEVLGSQETIAAHTGQTPRYFCYPGGRYNETTIEVLSELNFWGALTTEGGNWHGFDDRYEWSRLRMRNTTPLAEFASFVEPGDAVSGKPVDS